MRTLFFSSEATRGEKEKTTTRLRGGGVGGGGGGPPLPALINGFSGGKKNIKFNFPPPRNKTSHVLTCSINLAIHQF